MFKKSITRIISLILCMSLFITLCSCSKAPKKYNMSFSETKKAVAFSLNNTDASNYISLSQNDASKLINEINNIQVSFPYSELFEVEECYKRLQSKVFIESHNSSITSFDALTPASFTANIKQNNTEYLKDNTFGLEEPNEEYLLELSELIIDTISSLKKQLPEIDYSRVLCNLSNLKILYKKGMVDNAQVTSDMVMYLSPNMFQIVNLMSGEYGCRNVVIHEIMHIVQLGCKCEKINHCTRRCGISYRWDDFEANTSDFNWLFEGSAERMMCNITGDAPLTYKYMINYICTMNLTTMFQDHVSGNFLETISFYDDIEKLYSLFACESKESKIELLNMLIAINIIQTSPDEFKTAYALAYGKDTENSETIDEINYTLKPEVCIVLTKQFYKQLLFVLDSQKNITTNDLLFIINLFESSLDNHLKYTNSSNNKFNLKFLKQYLQIRTSFFDRVSSSTGSNLNETYNSYSSVLNENTINASLKWLSKDKVDFLLERIDYLEFNRDSKIRSEYLQ